MDWELTCRVCLEGGDMVSLFDCDENNEQLSEKYKYTTGIEVTESDSLPTLICLTCVDRLMFAYQFRQQCITNHDTLQECLVELKKSNAVVGTKNAENSEVVTIKQENGIYVKYELPVEAPGSFKSVLTSAPPQKKRGRPRKYPNKQGEIAASPYKRKTKPVEKNEPSLAEILSRSANMKQEPEGESENLEFLDDTAADDPEYTPDDLDDDFVPPPPKIKETKSKRRIGRPPKQSAESSEDILLKETIMAYSEPLAEEALKPTKSKPKKSSTPKKKSYNYDKTHTCETCGNSFRSNASLQAHIRRHLGIKPYVCSVCNYSCVLNMELRRHMMRHTGVRPYKCRICDRRFGDFGSRQKHERLHLGERPYQCSLCGKAFTYSYVLSNHMLTHTGEKKYSCAPCNKKFTKAHHLKYHNKVHHKELYLQQQMEMEAKRVREQIKITDISSVLSSDILEGHVQLVHAEGDNGEMQLRVIEEGREGEVGAEEVQYSYVEGSQMDMPDMNDDENELIVGDTN